MAQKKITDLQLRDDVSDELSIPSDDGIQSYRVTALQFKTYILPDEAIVRAKIAPAERLPIGAVIPFAGTTAPTGYLICDGSAVSRTTYAALFAVIDEFHGQGDNSTTFNIPDYRGRFLRGVANGQATDPDRASRTAMATGGNTGDNVGSVQGHAFQTHTHTQNSHNHTQDAHDHIQGNSTNGTARYGSTTTSNATRYVADTLTTGGTNTQSVTATNNVATAVNQNAAASGATSQTSTAETRPVNAYVNYLIKY